MTPFFRNIFFILVLIIVMFSAKVSVYAQVVPSEYDTSTWNVIFEENFDGTALDTSVWEPSWFTGTDRISPPVNSSESGCYDPQQVSVSEGTLKLTARLTTNSQCKKRDGSVSNYASGLVNTRNSFTFAYGYMEARVYMPGSNGEIWNWPAFWSDGTGKWPQTGEIDVMEGLSGHQPCYHYHYEDANGNHQGPGGCVNWEVPYGWHTFGALWEPGKVTYYYNGEIVGVISEGIVSAEHFLILNYGVRESYGINVPATMEVDYVKVWKLPSDTPRVSPSPSPISSPGSGGGNNDLITLPLEAENALLSLPMSVYSDPNASSGEYVTSTTNDAGEAKFAVNIPVTDQYVIWARVLAPADGQDSFTVEIDTGSVVSTDGQGRDVFDSYPKTHTSEWVWIPVNGRGASSSFTVDPRIFELSAGNHVIDFSGREANAKLDKIVITNDTTLTYVPDLEGSNPTPIPDASPSTSPSPTTCKGDFNFDGIVDLIDYQTLVSNFWSKTPSPSEVDINQDGIVDINDYVDLLAVFFTTCQN